MFKWRQLELGFWQFERLESKNKYRIVHHTIQTMTQFVCGLITPKRRRRQYSQGILITRDHDKWWKSPRCSSIAAKRRTSSGYGDNVSGGDRCCFLQPRFSGPRSGIDEGRGSTRQRTTSTETKGKEILGKTTARGTVASNLGRPNNRLDTQFPMPGRHFAEWITSKWLK